MENNFMFEIITPEKVIFSENINMVTIPSYEGDMTVLKNHISIISFLRPGMINVFKNEESSETFFVQDGTVEFFNNNMVVLSTSVENIKNLSKDFINNLDAKIVIFSSSNFEVINKILKTKLKKFDFVKKEFDKNW